MIRLAPLHKEHVSSFYKWIRDPEVIRYSLSAFQTMQSEQQINEWFAAVVADTASLNLGVYLEDTSVLIGYAGISSISKANQSGEYFILLGDKNCWGKGIGTAVTKQVVDIGFTARQLNRIMLTVSELNIGGLKAYVKAGFVLEGRMRKACLRDGLFHDKLLLSVLKSEWQEQAV